MERFHAQIFALHTRRCSPTCPTTPAGEVEAWYEELAGINAIAASDPGPQAAPEPQFDFEMATDDERIAWLSERGPLDWHKTVLSCNWDWGAKIVMPWIADQPRCDTATALQIFLFCEPSYYAKYESREEVIPSNQWTYDLVHGIYENLLSFAYPTRNYQLHDNGNSLKNYLQRQARAERENKPPSFPLPAAVVEGFV